MGDRIIKDAEFGDVVITINTRMRSRGAKIVYAGGLRLEVSPFATDKEIMSLIDYNRAKLRMIVKKAGEASKQGGEEQKVGFGYRFPALTFDINIVKSDRTDFRLKYIPSAKGSRGEVDIFCPDGTDFEAENIVMMLNAVAMKYAKKEAERLFPQMLMEVSERTGLKYNSVKIISAKGRWGSCSSQKSIHLSYRMMFLTLDLLLGVIVHELCHTVYMNHSKDFWALFEKLSGKTRAQTVKEERECLSRWPMFLRV